MTLGSDVSGLSTTAASAAAKGLSIVVPLYNEAAGLALLHERLIAVLLRNTVAERRPGGFSPSAGHGNVIHIYRSSFIVTSKRVK